MIGKILALTLVMVLVLLATPAQSTDDWRVDQRRPGMYEGSAPSSVEWWRVDDRRPAPWPHSRPVLDSDGDGVLDSHDECPDTPRGTKVDEKGCPLSEKEIVLLDTGTLTLDDVHFETNKAVILPESYAALDEIGEILEKWDELQIEIGGHTDNQGEEDYNLDLSGRRAQAVLDYLTGKFAIDPGQYVARGYGESQPVAGNDTPEGRAENRRVEFKVLNREVLEREEPGSN